MAFDLVLANARIAGGGAGLVDIGVRGGLIAAVASELGGDDPRHDLGGRLVLPGLVETHIHLDKSALSDRCDCSGGALAEAVAAVAAAKRDFTQTDVRERASRTLERAILQGTMRMRTHVEVDPRIGLTSLEALTRLARDYAWAIDLEICAFPQEGLLDDPGCEAVLVAALESGADLVGGAPYMDRDSHGHIARIFDLARGFDVDIDFHLDFSLDASRLDVEEVCRQTERHGWGGRVAVGHVTKLSMLPAQRLDDIGRRLAGAGVAVTVLPATDLFLMGRDQDHAAPRGVAPAHRLRALGVTCSIATNNVLNPFTPFGDCSLIRMANLYANIAQVGSAEGLAGCLDMVTVDAAKLMRLGDYGLAEGSPADVLVLDCETPTEAVAELAPVVMGFKRGRQSFARPAARLLPP
jgi:cytosine deaminase